jgi:hypothetical protein
MSFLTTTLVQLTRMAGRGWEDPELWLIHNVESPPVWGGSGTILSMCSEAFYPRSQRPRPEAPGSTYQELGIWLVMMEGALLQWVTLITHLTFSRPCVCTLWKLPTRIHDRILLLSKWRQEEPYTYGPHM